MGNLSQCTLPKLLSQDFQVPDLKSKNNYGQTQQIQQKQIFQKIFVQSHNSIRNSRVVQVIKDNNQVFADDKFIIDSKQKTRLSVLFDYNRIKTKIYQKKNNYQLTNFIQLNIQFTYLSVVFYLLCRKQVRQTFLEKIIENQETNDYGAYVLNFFCNGQKHQVLIDDQMPIINDSFLYTRIVKEAQVWPLLLEKAWCKQIGSYQRAKGLSPQDSFEQIIGAPSYSYKFRIDNRDFMKQTLKQAQRLKYWVSLVARNGLQDLQDRQVFYLQQIDDYQCKIISPYTSFKFFNSQSKTRGSVKVKHQDIFTHFQYAVIGFYKQNYQNISIPITCKSHQQLLFEINVKNQQQISIRFNQFYQGYLKQQQRMNYKYSPVLIQLYQVWQKSQQKRYDLLHQCQGCNRALSGARSIHCSKEIFTKMKGKYILKMEVNWQFQSLLNKGNLVIYSSKNNVQIVPLKNDFKIVTQIHRSLFLSNNLKDSKATLNEQNIQITTFNKMHTTIFMIKNLINSLQNFTIQFKYSVNILIRGGTINKNKTTIQLQPLGIYIIQILPDNIRQGFSFDGLDIIRNDLRK